MARPAVEKLTYFPHDVGLMTDEKFRPLKEDFGLLAPSVYLTLLEMIYGDKGYYLPLKEKDSLKWLTLSVSDRLQDRRVKLAEITRVVQALVEADLFDAELLRRRNVLSSRRIQRTYLKSTEKRTTVKLDPGLILLTAEETQELIGSRKVTLVENGTGKDGGDAPVSGEGTDISVSEMLQRKAKQEQSEKESEKERRAVNSKEEACVEVARMGEPAPDPVSWENFLKVKEQLTQRFGRLTALDEADLKSWREVLDRKDFEYAANEAIMSDAHSINYAFSIMRRLWEKNKPIEYVIEKRPITATTNFWLPHKKEQSEKDCSEENVFEDTVF